MAGMNPQLALLSRDDLVAATVDLRNQPVCAIKSATRESYNICLFPTI